MTTIAILVSLLVLVSAYAVYMTVQYRKVLKAGREITRANIFAWKHGEPIFLTARRQ